MTECKNDKKAKPNPVLKKAQEAAKSPERKDREQAWYNEPIKVYSEKVDKTLNEVDKKFDKVRSAGAYANKYAGIANGLLKTYNDAVAETNLNNRACEVMSPVDLIKIRQEEELEFANLGEEILLACIGDDDLGIPPKCSSRIFEAAKAVGDNPLRIFDLLELLTESRSIVDCASPYWDRFMNIIPYQYYIALFLEKSLGKLLEEFIDELGPEEQQEIWQQTPCGQEQLTTFINKSVPLGQIPPFPEIPYLPPLPYINIPSIKKILKNLMIDVLCYAICCILEGLLSWTLKAMEEIMNQYIEDENAGILTDPAGNFMGTELDKIDLNKYLTDESVREMIQKGFVDKTATTSEVREYIRFVCSEELHSIKFRHIVYLMLGEANCPTLNILLLLGNKWPEKDFDEEYSDLGGMITPDVLGAAYKEILPAAAKVGISTNDPYYKLGLDTEKRIIKFFEFIGENINVFQVIAEAKENACIPDPCILKDEMTKDKFLGLMDELCNLLNPELGLPDIGLDVILSSLGVKQQVIRTIETQLESMYQEIYDIISIEQSGLEQSGVFKDLVFSPGVADGSGTSVSDLSYPLSPKQDYVLAYADFFQNALPSVIYTATSKTNTKKVKLTDIEIDAVITFPKVVNVSGEYIRRTYFFSGDDYYRYNDLTFAIDPGYPKKISDNWPGIPNNIDAATVYSNPDSQTTSLYFFKGDKYYRYNTDKNKVDPGYPKPISVWNGVPNDLDAALELGSNNQVYFFKGDKYWKYDKANNKVLPESPLKIKDEWGGMPDNISAAFTWQYGGDYILESFAGLTKYVPKIKNQTYFFKGNKYTVYDDDGNKPNPNKTDLDILSGWKFPKEITEKVLEFDEKSKSILSKRHSYTAIEQVFDSYLEGQSLQDGGKEVDKIVDAKKYFDITAKYINELGNNSEDGFVKFQKERQEQKKQSAQNEYNKQQS